jgi:hypothetical protein
MKTLITALMLTVMGTAGFADMRNPSIQTANTIIPKGRLISTLNRGFVMTHKGKVYVCYPDGYRVHCKENIEH